mmetsp:Transcript_20372/g.63882  ORF Transcript_20372/g.63882 Transcript_20372/m.63882 type:complete len:312 (-) Transcript_20372:311-1246(-)
MADCFIGSHCLPFSFALRKRRPSARPSKGRRMSSMISNARLLARMWWTSHCDTRPSTRGFATRGHSTFVTSCDKIASSTGIMPWDTVVAAMAETMMSPIRAALMVTMPIAAMAIRRLQQKDLKSTSVRSEKTLAAPEPARAMAFPAAMRACESRYSAIPLTVLYGVSVPYRMRFRSLPYSASAPKSLLATSLVSAAKLKMFPQWERTSSLPVPEQLAMASRVACAASTMLHCTSASEFLVSSFSFPPPWSSSGPARTRTASDPVITSLATRGSQDCISATAAAKRFLALLAFAVVSSLQHHLAEQCVICAT